jgi:hypothetical protein
MAAKWQMHKMVLDMYKKWGVENTSYKKISLEDSQGLSLFGFAMHDDPTWQDMEKLSQAAYKMATINLLFQPHARVSYEQGYKERGIIVSEAYSEGELILDLHPITMGLQFIKLAKHNEKIWLRAFQKLKEAGHDKLYIPALTDEELESESLINYKAIILKSALRPEPTVEFREDTTQVHAEA